MNYIALQSTYAHLISILPIINMYTKSYITKLTEPRVIYNNIRNISTNYNKKCTDCMFYREGVIKEESECLKFGKTFNDKNSVNFYYAKDCRNDEEKCGKTGLYYISKLLK